MNNRKKMITAVMELPEYTDEVYQETPVIRMFTPDARAQWFLAERNQDGIYTFGLCDLGFPELGYVFMPELYASRAGQFGLPIELDEGWNGTMADAYEKCDLPVPSWLKSKEVEEDERGSDVSTTSA